MFKGRLFKISLIMAALSAFMVFGTVAASASGNNSSGADGNNSEPGAAVSALAENVGAGDISAAEFLGFHNMLVGDSVGTSESLDDVWSEDRDVFLLRNGDETDGTLDVEVIDCCLEGDHMLLLVFVRQPDGTVSAHPDFCVSPETCNVSVPFAPGALALGVTGYVDAPGGFPAGYEWSASLN